jgi:hypothetical protein
MPLVNFPGAHAIEKISITKIFILAALILSRVGSRERYELSFSDKIKRDCAARLKINRIALEPRAHVRVFALLCDSIANRSRLRCSTHFSNERRNAACILDQHYNARELDILEYSATDVDATVMAPNIDIYTICAPITHLGNV